MVAPAGEIETGNMTRDRRPSIVRLTEPLRQGLSAWVNTPPLYRTRSRKRSRSSWLGNSFARLGRPEGEFQS